MIKSSILKDLAEKLTNVLPEQVNTFKQDFEKSCHRILTQTFNKFDLVTREEFDTQTKVLQRTRKKLDALEKQLHELDTLLKNKSV